MTSALVVVLTYHSISEGPGPLCSSPRQLERQLDRLLAAGFEPLAFSALVQRLTDGEPLPRRAFVATFDDGYRDFATEAVPILERRGLPATLFVTASDDRERLPGGTGAALLALEDLAALRQSGVEIGAHSLTHRDLTALDQAALESELADGRRILEDVAGCPVEHFAYPFGGVDARVRAAVGEHFRAACTTRLAAVSAADDPLLIPRLDAYYLDSALLSQLLAWGRPQPYLRVRGWLRRLRGSEPRRPGVSA